MRNATLARAAVLAAAALFVASGLLAAEPADVKLPFNPLESAAEGDWALYKVSDPASGEPLPPEMFSIRSVTNGAILVTDASQSRFRYKQGQAGASAIAFLHGFFGEVRESLAPDLRSITVTADPIKVGGRAYDAIRIDANLVTKFTDAESNGRGAGEMKTKIAIWVARGVHGIGMVKTKAWIDLLGETHAGFLELDQHGTAAEKPVFPGDAAQAATATAKPEK